MKLLLVCGARPNFMKIAPLMRAIDCHNEAARRNDRIEAKLVHTGQHYDSEMSESFFRDLSLPNPDHYLGVGSDSHAKQTAEVMIAFEPIVLNEKPDCVVVVGDVNSTLACALTAAKLRIPVAHVEAGLRSFDRSMPEEINRLVTDAVSDYLFTPSEDSNANLRREGVPEEKIHFVGNIMVDALRKHQDLARSLRAYARYGLPAFGYAVLTLHRPSNVDDSGTLLRFLRVLEQVQAQLPVLFPVHPRTRDHLRAWGLMETVEGIPGVRLCEPLSYIDFLSLLCGARLVLTDSGGIQEETTALGVPCLTLRDNTERPVTVTHGTNMVVGTHPERIMAAVGAVLGGEVRLGRIPPLWDGRTASRIVKVLAARENSRSVEAV